MTLVAKNKCFAVIVWLKLNHECTKITIRAFVVIFSTTNKRFLLKRRTSEIITFHTALGILTS